MPNIYVYLYMIYEHIFVITFLKESDFMFFLYIETLEKFNNQTRIIQFAIYCLHIVKSISIYGL